LLSTFVLNVASRLAGDEPLLSRLGKIFTNSTSIKSLPVPYKPRAIPFNDELPEKPVSPHTTMMVKTGFVLGMGGLLWLTTKGMRIPIEELGNWGTLGPIRRAWTGQPILDDFMDKLVSALSYPILGRDPAPSLQLVYFLSQLISPLLVYTVEGHRLGNQATPLALPSFLNVGMQVQGVARMAPLHAALSALFTHESPVGRFIRPEVAQSLIPALTLGYIIPTILAFAPRNKTRSWQNWVAVWQLAPPAFSALTWAFSKGIRWWRHRSQSSGGSDEKEQNLEHFDRYSATDIPALQFAYKYAFAVQATAHVATLAYALSSGLSLSRTFFGLPNIFNGEWNLPDTSSKLNVFFKFDQLFATTSIFASNLYSVWDLRRLGYISTKQALQAAFGIVAGQAVVGSSATWAALWHWREKVLSSMGR
jgi:hypothetical protein